MGLGLFIVNRLLEVCEEVNRLLEVCEEGRARTMEIAYLGVIALVAES